MAIPHRMNNVPVEIVPLKTTAALIDGDYKEPAKKQYDEANPYILQGQPFYNEKEKQQKSFTGDEDNSTGRVTFKRAILETAALISGDEVLIKKGDMITKIAGASVRYKIIEVRYTAHLNGIWNTARCVFVEDEYTRNSV